MICRLLSLAIMPGCLYLAGCAAQAVGQPVAEPTDPPPAATPADAADRSITVFPVGLKPNRKVSEGIKVAIARVIGISLERSGLKQVELAEAKFASAETEDLQQATAAFAEFVRKQAPKTKYALYGELVGTPQTGLKKIRTILVDRQGNVVLAEDDDASTYARVSDITPKDPMTCTLFIARKIGKLWDLADPLREDAPPGKLAQGLRRESGLPPNQELDAIESRRKAAVAKLAAGKPLKMAVYPVHVGPTSDRQCAECLVGLLKDVIGGEIAVLDIDPKLEIKGHYNEQKVLWDTARAVRDFVKRHPPEADYVLYADYAIGRAPSGKAKVGFVHFIVCDRTGEWVAVDFQNSHHADFQQIDPQSPDDCNRLVVRRIQRGLAE